jgi:DNA invertase Pin-like site-specific DNA recombinase
LQRDALKRAGCEKIIEDTVSGGKVQRPGLERVHDALRSGDLLAVWRLDRLGRSLKHLIELMAELVPTMNKPFDVLAEGLVSESSRGDRTPIELFISGGQGWNAVLQRIVAGASEDARSS